jgi:hypothetical protein
MFLLKEIAVSILVPFVLAVVLNWLWPDVKRGLLAFAAGMAMPVAMIFLFLSGLWRLSSPHDYEGLTYALAPFIGLILVLLNSALTFPVALLTMHALRRNAP